MPDGMIRDPELQRIPLTKLQKNTRPALRAAGLTLKQLARKLPKLPVERLQELMNGQKPTAAEIQLLKENLGADFNTRLKNQILAHKPNLPPGHQVLTVSKRSAKLRDSRSIEWHTSSTSPAAKYFSAASQAGPSSPYCCTYPQRLRPARHLQLEV